MLSGEEPRATAQTAKRGLSATPKTTPLEKFTLYLEAI